MCEADAAGRAAGPRAAGYRGPAFFFDRDDTLVHDEGYMSRPEQLRLAGGAAEALRAAKNAGWKLYLLTNQSGIGRGYYTMADAEACNRRLEEMLGIRFDGICIAPERPDEPSRYRKPSPAFVLEKIASDGLDRARCVVVGDKISDVECGLRAGVAAALVARVSTGETRPDAAAFALSRSVAAFPSAQAAVEAFLHGGRFCGKSE